MVGDGWTNKTTVTVSGTGAEANAWVSVFNGSTQLARVRAQADGSWNAVLAGLTQGSYSLQARQSDAAGNVSVASSALALVVDTVAAAPTLALSTSSQAASSQPGYTMQSQPTFTGTAEAGATVQLFDGALLLGTAVADTSGNWSLTSATALSLGNHSNVFAVQTDKAGNTSPASASLLVTVLSNMVTNRTFSLPGHWTFSLSAGDINGDGKTDLYMPVFSNTAKLLLGDGTGAMVDGVHNMPWLNGSNYNTIGSTMVDFNGDGRLDVVALAETQNSTVTASLSSSFFVNRGGPNNMVNTAVAADAYVSSVRNSGLSTGNTSLSVLGDLNGDGYLDLGFSNSPVSAVQANLLLSTGPGIWRNVLASSYLGTSDAVGKVAAVDVNGDGCLDLLVSNMASAGGSGAGDTVTVRLADGHGGYNTVNSWTLTPDKFSTTTSNNTISTFSQMADLNGDGQLDMLGAGNQVAFGRGDGSFAVTTVAVSGGGLAADQMHVTIADVNGDGRNDLVYVDTNNRLVVGIQNADGSFTNQAAAMGWEAGGAVSATALINSSSPVYEGLTGVSTAIELVDVNNDRSLDLVVMGSTRYSMTANVVLNPTPVAENTFLRVMVANDHGGLDAYGALVRLYDHATGALVAVRQASTNAMASQGNSGSYGADFFGLDPLKSYDISVVYPGSDKGVTVLTGKAGLGVGNVAPGALNQIVDSSLTAVTPSGKDVIWVAKENRSTSSSGGYWQGSGLADQMVGDAGNDVFKPNGARVGEAGDTLTGGGGKDRYVFDVKEVLNTPATITDFCATAGADADSLDFGVLLTSLGYTGPRTAAGVAGWVNLVDSGGNTTLQIDAHSGTNGAASGFVDVVKLNGVTGNSLATLVSGGFVHLGGLQVSGIASDQVVSETLSMAGVQLAAGATLAAEGGQWAAGFGGGKLQVSLDNATATDTLGFGSTGGVSYDAVSHAVQIGGVQVATVDSTYNGVGAVGKLAMAFDFSNAGASYSTAAQQAAAVQTVLQSIKLTSNTYAPLALDRGITFTLTDALGDTQDVYSGLHITPEANNGTLGGVNYITGTESVETLVGTTANETLVGYNGVPTTANTANLGTAFTFGDTLTGGGGQDTFKWLRLQTMNSDAANKIMDFGLKGGTGTGQGAAEADVIDLADLLQGYGNSSTLADYVRATNVGGKVQIQVDTNGKANGSGFESTWFLTLDNLSVNANNEVLVNGTVLSATAAGLSGNVTVDKLVQQMMADSQFKLL